MCGIAGLVSLDGTGPDLGLLNRMSEAAAHRGPDGSGVLSRGAVALAHRRLAIVGLGPGGAQPMVTADGRLAVTYNGEIYNWLELRHELRGLGHTFSTDCDTEVLLAAYAEWGARCVDRFNGMWAFVIHDAHARTVFCSRDRFGVKPLLWARIGQTVAFASEPEQLLAFVPSRRADRTTVRSFLASGIDEPLKATFFEGIAKVPGGHSLTIDLEAGTVRERREYSLTDRITKLAATAEDAAGTIGEALRASVSLRLRADVPVGTCLSGGLDSGILAVLGKDLMSDEQPWPSFSAIFPGFAKDESEAIRFASAQACTTAHFATPDASSLLEDIHTLAWHQEEPFTTAGIYAQYRVHRLARQMGVKVLIDGQGADEVFAGYARYTHWHLQQRLAAFDARGAESEASLLQANGFLPDWGWQNRIAAFLPSLAASRLEARAFRTHEADADISPTFRDRASGAGFIRKPVVRKLNDILYHDACQGPLQELLRYADRNAMSQGVEVRLPYLDTELVQFLFSLPNQYKYREGFTKWILRKAYHKRITEAVAWRKGKTGFEPPQLDWMLDARVTMEVRKGQERLVEAGMLSASVLKRAVVPSASYATDSRDWRHWIASLFL
ncbi:MAG: asparagine synthase (glutamine-hydrolyzing) [Chitinophagia bacterium]|nr:asparagine synthase (glutamine-hydrolyzing) [Chitinophagia bacterium]